VTEKYSDTLSADIAIRNLKKNDNSGKNIETFKETV